MGNSPVRYATVESSDGGTMTDVRPYLAWLEQHADELPPGARTFALHPEHYDFSHQWCPRSASFDRMSTRHTDDGVEVVLVLAAWGEAPPEFVVRYHGVSHIELDGDQDDDMRSNLMADELLPHADGVSHELEFTNRTITVVARDLTAGWRGKAGPESPRDPGDDAGEVSLATLVWHLQHRPRMFVMDDSFATLAAFVGGFDWARERLLRGFSRWLHDRLRTCGPNIVWERHIVEAVVPPERQDVRQRDLTAEEDTAACALALDLLSTYLAERGDVAE
ncbi:hypothetical protein [Promicromonospora kroppenstedtii]|uniref:hypothetical protein n=1 Tax=Promicromonospora kroppenstedtii TaxID=440482 RepID=UPI00146F9D5C|nr:hypothetical protein [Promicromonospora kroppenstedtii]